ncbi:MAG: DegT/DnrJ/EryC1/StrS family aminotransferase [Verrucomicrobiia bacterium]
MNPRFRTYSTSGTYGRITVDALLGRTGRGDDLTRFEEAVKQRTGAPFALCMPQARVGIFMAIRGLISPGQKVILSPYTIYDVVNMVICAGGVPVFADIDRATCNLNPESVKELLDLNTGAVLVTHLHGLTMDLQELAETCRQKRVPLIEDAAQALGARSGGQPVGTIGDAGIYSFGLYKNVNAFYGGMVVTKRKDLHDRLRAELEALPIQKLLPLLQRVGYGLMTELLTWPPFFRLLPFHVFRYAYLHDVESLNRRVREENDPQIKRALPPRYLRRMRPVQARLAVKALSRVDPDSAIRLGFARMYQEGLSDLPELLLPPFRQDGSHIYIQYPIQYPDRKALVKHMMRMGCDVMAQHMRNCADMECFGEFHRECPNARATANAVVVLPTYSKYARQDVERNIRAIRAFFGKETAKAPGTRRAEPALAAEAATR